jgi:hypothetical protein
MKKYTNLSQLITEQAEDAKFKIEGRPEDNLLNGVVLKRFTYSYTYPKNSAAIVTPAAILDYITKSSEGDANQIKTVINSLSSPAAVGISADPSDKAGLFGGKNRVEGHVYLFKNIPESAVTSVNPDQLIGKTGTNNITSFQVLSTPRTGGESIQQNLAKIISAAGKSSTSGNSSSSAKSSSSTSTSNSSGSKLTMMELQVTIPQLGPGGKENGASYYFKKVVNGLFRNVNSADALIKEPVKVSCKSKSYSKGDKSIFITEKDSKLIEAGFSVRGPGIPPNTLVTKKGDVQNSEVEISISNPAYSTQGQPTIGFYNNYIFPESESPVMVVISKFFSIQKPLNSIVSAQTATYTQEIKSAFTEILNKSGDPDYKVDASYNLDELTKSQLVSIMTVWLLYAANNGVINISEIETDTYPTIKNFVDILTGAASTANAQVSTINSMDLATNMSNKQKQINRVAGKASIENVEELKEILLGAGYPASVIMPDGTKLRQDLQSALVTTAGDAYKNTSAWKYFNPTDNTKNIEFDTSEIGSFNDNGTARVFTPEYTGIHSALGLLRKILSPAMRKSTIPGEPAINPVPTDAVILAGATRKDGAGKLIGPNTAEIAAVKAGFGWGPDLEQAITFFRKKHYNIP